MKKLSILMALVLMLVAIVPVAATPATAAEATPASSSMDEALITHFDFTHVGDQGNVLNRVRPLDVSGHGVTEQLFHQKPNNANGVSTLTGDGTDYMSMNNYQDFASCTTGMTAFIAVKLGGVDDTWLTLFSAGVGNHPVFRILVKNASIVVQHRYAESITYEGVEANQWLWIVASVDYSASGNTLAMHISLDEGVTWNSPDPIAFDAVELPQNINNLRLGRGLSGTTLEAEKYDVIYDDIQIWNRALTADEVKTITAEESTPNTMVYQTRAGAQANTFDIRFCAAVDTYALSYESLRYKVVVKNGEGTELATTSLSTTTVYISVIAMGEPYSAAEMGSDYLTAVAITDIPTTLGELTFEVTPSFANEEMTFTGPTTVFTYNPAA